MMFLGCPMFPALCHNKAELSKQLFSLVLLYEERLVVKQKKERVLLLIENLKPRGQMTKVPLHDKKNVNLRFIFIIFFLVFFFYTNTAL